MHYFTTTTVHLRPGSISDTAQMPSIQEKTAFSLRLRQALKRSAKKIETPTELALHFNLRHEGTPITPQAAQKWLSGGSIPTLEKIETLTAWLNVSRDWLRTGIAEERPASASARKVQKAKAVAAVPASTEELKLLEAIRTMPEHRRQLVIEIVEQFTLEQAMWRE